MSPWTCRLVALALCLPGSVRAQRDTVARRHDARIVDSASFRRGVVHYGKWLPVAAAAAFTAMGAHEHASSQREFDRLLALCRANTADCLLGPDGRYLNPAAEQLYQASVTFDRRARARLLAGQVSLIVAAGLFILDLRRHSGGPANKPFAPLKVAVDERTGGALVGVRVTF